MGEYPTALERRGEGRRKSWAVCKWEKKWSGGDGGHDKGEKRERGCLKNRLRREEG